MEAFAYFPSLVYRDEKPDWVQPATLASKKHYDWIEQQRPDLPKTFPVRQTGHMADDPDFGPLRDYILESSVNILRWQGYAVDQYEFYVQGMWGQDHKCYGQHWPHIHANSQISGFFFLEVPEGGSYPIIHDPRHQKMMVELWHRPSEEITNATSAVHFQNIRPGTVLFMNSWLPHQFPPNPSENPLKFIHFNVAAKERPCQQCNII